ncbi:hypothetical protein BDR26DRAFT_863639 [Obelidium mucronatum]|nr:hypothetical protein BDR26DRAFT_863639 [Obelidium mucronatum]
MLPIDSTQHMEAVLASLNSLFTSKQFSDIGITAFGHTFNLHRPILVSNAYFSSLLNGGWSDQNKNGVELKFDDPNITLEAVTVVFKRIYGIYTDEISEDSVCAWLAAASFFDDQSLCKQCACFIECHTEAANISKLLDFADAHYYGLYSGDIITNCLLYLCRNAASFPNCLDNIADKWLIKVLGSKYLVVENEGKRCTMIQAVCRTREEAFREGNDALQQLPTNDDPVPSESNQHLANILSKCVIFSQIAMSNLVEIHKRDLVAEDILLRAQWRRGRLSTAISSAVAESTKLDCMSVAPYSFENSIMSTPVWNKSDFEPFRVTKVIPAGNFKQPAFGNNAAVSHFFYGGSFWSLRIKKTNLKVMPALCRLSPDQGATFAAKKADFACDERPRISVQFQLFLFKGNKLVINTQPVCSTFMFGSGHCVGAIQASELFGTDNLEFEPIEELVIGCNMVLE